MSNISNYLEEILLNLMFRATAYPGGAPATVYCGLVDNVGTDAELEAGTLTHEITTYTGDRKAITFKVPAQVGADPASKATIKNDPAIEFENMPAMTVKYAIVCDAATGGNILYWCPLAAEKTCNAGDTFRIPVDALVLDLA
ncbi:unnamed protein product [marine sediment metagenome]|uniref:Uncharacterized protein n=1 Tax=marine sediment metagenome TaxID=412755 RepID=X1Q5N1_9ZZZZ